MMHYEFCSVVFLFLFLFLPLIFFFGFWCVFCRAILRSNCYHTHGHDAPCKYGGSYYMLMFGAAQLFLSFIPDFHDMAWLSVLAAVMSFSYSFIGLGLGLANTIGTLCFGFRIQSVHPLRL